MTLLLDTCAFIWLTSAPEFLGAKAAQALGEPSNDRALSLASIWEITLKHHSGKLPLPSPPEVWIEEQLRLQDIEVLPMQRVVLYPKNGSWLIALGAEVACLWGNGTRFNRLKRSPSG